MADERSMRFGYLLSEIEINARLILDGAAKDVQLALSLIQVSLTEARALAGEVSREALDKVIEIHPLSPDGDEP